MVICPPGVLIVVGSIGVGASIAPRPTAWKRSTIFDRSSCVVQKSTYIGVKFELSIIKRELFGLKRIAGNTTRQLTTPNKSPRSVGDCLVSIRPLLNSSLQIISIFQIHQILNISYFSQFNLFFEEKYLFPKMSKNHPKIYTKPPNGGYGNEQRDLALLKT